MKNVKISKKVASLLVPRDTEGNMIDCPIASSAASAKVSRQIDGGHVAKDGSVSIEVDDAEVGVLRAHADERIAFLDGVLPTCETDEARRPYFGELSAWRGLVRQFDPIAA